MSVERTYKALLIGNATYANDVELTNLLGPINDVDAMRAALTDKNWGLHDPANVEVLVEGSKGDVEGAIEDFFASASKDDQLLLFFSGHGLQVVNDRLYLGVADTRSDRPHSTAVAMSLVNELAGETRAVATTVVLDCCYSGIMKAKVDYGLDGRGRWTLASTSRDQLSVDAGTADGTSAFSGLVAQGLCDPAADANQDGYITFGELAAYVGPKLETATGQTLVSRHDAGGELVLALAPGYSTDYEQTRYWAVSSNNERVAVRDVPAALPGLEDSGPDRRDAAPARVGAEDLVPRDEADLVTFVREQLDNGKPMLVREAIQRITKEASRLNEGDDTWEELAARLDQLTCLSATFLNHGLDDWFDFAIASLRVVYEQGFDSRGFSKASSANVSGVNPTELWLAILERLLGIGAQAVRAERWDLAYRVAMQRPNGHDFRHYNNWIRHAVTQAARANLLREEQDGRFVERSVIVVAKEYASRHDCLTPDIPAESERLLDSLCQFDALACVAAASTSDVATSSDFYPNFARFHGERTSPMFERILHKSGVRATVAPIPDAQLANVLHEIGRVATSEGWRYDGFRGYSLDISDWIDAHLTSKRA